MKSIFRSLALVLTTSLVFSGCNEGGSGQTSTSASSAEVATPVENPEIAVAETTPIAAKTESGVALAKVVDWSTQSPFLDLMKQARKWRDVDDRNREFAVDDRGWITSLKEGQTVGTVFLTIPNDAPVYYERAIVIYEGEGEIEYGWKAKKIAAESQPGRDVVSLGRGNHILKIVRTNPDNYIRNIRIIPEKHLEAYQQGEIFNAAWLERVENFQSIRFMNWMRTNDSEQKFWSQRPQVEDRSWAVDGGVPLEVMLDLVNRLGADPWFNIPHLADLEYIREFAKLVEAKLDRDLNVYFEHSNEVWNWQFEQAQYANTVGRNRWGDRGNAYMQWHGMRTAQICDIFKQEAFEGEPQRVKCVLGAHPHWHGLEEGALECPLWVAEGNKPCYQHGFDYVGITTYFNGGLNGPRKAKDESADVHADILRGWLQEPDGGIGKAFEQLADGRHLRALEKYSDYQGVEAELRERLAYWKGSTEKYGLGMVAYEGGQHITANGHVLRDDEAVIDFHIAISRDPRMKDVYTSMLDLWQEYGGGLHVHFVDVAAPSKWGSWGALEHLDQPSSPKWEALMEFNQKLAQQSE